MRVLAPVGTSDFNIHYLIFNIRCCRFLFLRRSSLRQPLRKVRLLQLGVGLEGGVEGVGQEDHLPARGRDGSPVDFRHRVLAGQQEGEELLGLGEVVEQGSPTAPSVAATPFWIILTHHSWLCGSRRWTASQLATW